MNKVLKERNVNLRASLKKLINLTKSIDALYACSYPSKKIDFIQHMEIELDFTLQEYEFNLKLLKEEIENLKKELATNHTVE